MEQPAELLEKRLWWCRRHFGKGLEVGGAGYIGVFANYAVNANNGENL